MALAHAAGELMPSGDLQLSYNGLTVGKDTPYRIRSISGLRDFSVRGNDEGTATRWGTFIGTDQVESSSITIEFLFGWDPAVIRDLATAFSPEPPGYGDTLSELAWKWPDEPELFRWARVRRRSRSMTYQSERVGGATTMLVELQAPDPRAYSVTVVQEQLGGFVSDSLGSDIDTGTDLTVGSGTSLGFDFGGEPGSGSIFITNEGTTDTWPTVTFSGNISRWRLRNLTTGDYTEFAWPLSAGQVLVADMPIKATPRTGDAILIDGAPYYQAWQHPRVPLVLVPGVNELRFDVLEGDPSGATAQVEVRAAYI